MSDINSTELDWLINSGWVVDVSESLTTQGFVWRKDDCAIEVKCSLISVYGSAWRWNITIYVCGMFVCGQSARESYTSILQAARESHAVLRAWFLASERIRAHLRAHPENTLEGVMDIRY